MNVLFLDFDGVVNTPLWDESGSVCAHNWPEDGTVNNFQCVQWASEFCEKFDYKIVVTSSWRYACDYVQCLKNGGLRQGVEVVGCTPHLPGEGRSAEIHRYLEKHADIEVLSSWTTAATLMIWLSTSSCAIPTRGSASTAMMRR